MTYRGVGFCKERWLAQIGINGHLIFLGTFDFPELAAIAYDKAAIKYHGIKAKLNFTNRLITIRQEQVYRLCSPDFYNLTYKQAGLLLGISDSTIYCELQKIKEKCPSLFPLYMKQRNQTTYSYKSWMDFVAKEKF